MSLKNPKTLRKCEENLQAQMLVVQFFKMLIIPRALLKVTKLSKFLHFFLLEIILSSLLMEV